MNTSLERTNDNYGMSCSRPNDPIDCALDFQFVKNLPPEEVHTRALSARKLLGKAEKTLVSWLVEIQDRKLYQNFACSSIYHYASRYLKLAEHTVAEFLRSGRKLAELPLLSSAYEQGELSSTHIREITRVATPDTESFWYEAAKNCTTRKIEKMVAFTPKGGIPPGEGKEQALSLINNRPAEKKNFCDRAFLQKETAGPMTPGDQANPAGHLGTDTFSERTRFPAKKCLSPTSRRRARKSIPPAVRKRVLDRDGHCCQAPGCSSELFTVIHHIDPVALGGTDDEHQLITLCWSCHDLMHEGTLSVKGQAPDNLVWGERISP
jgi:hypothetical protein